MDNISLNGFDLEIVTNTLVPFNKKKCTGHIISYCHTNLNIK